MRDRRTFGLALFTAGLVGVFGLLGMSCDSSEDGLDFNGPQNGTAGAGGGGTANSGGTSGSSSSTSPLFPLERDAGSSSGPVARKDAGVRPEGGVQPDGHVELYGLSPGTYCYKITSIVPGFSDGCQLGVLDVVGLALPANYDVSTGTFSLGTSASLGTGLIQYNVGTLTSSKTGMSDPYIPGCTWNQTDTTTLTMTGTNQFTVAVVEREDSITAACGMPAATCTSTWTWTMAIDGTLQAPYCK